MTEAGLLRATFNPEVGGDAVEVVVGGRRPPVPPMPLTVDLVAVIVELTVDGMLVTALPCASKPVVDQDEPMAVDGGGLMRTGERSAELKYTPLMVEGRFWEKGLLDRGLLLLTLLLLLLLFSGDDLGLLILAEPPLSDTVFINKPPTEESACPARRELESCPFPRQ